MAATISANVYQLCDGLDFRVSPADAESGKIVDVENKN
jgi:hypothetical protein